MSVEAVLGAPRRLKADRAPRVMFAALDTFSRVGGLQQFNQRVIRGLVALKLQGAVTSLAACLMRDEAGDVPERLREIVHPFGPDRRRFMRGAVADAKSADILLLGHINLLPVGVLAKLVHPKLKLFLFVHGDEVWNSPVYRPRRLYEPTLLRFVDRISSVSEYTARIMAEEFSVDRRKFTILPNAVDPIMYSEPDQREERVLTVTRLAAHDHGKHVDAVIRAFALVSAKRPNARLDIIGEGVLRPGLEQLARELGISDKASFMGRVSDSELQRAYAKASVFVLPSSKEGFGIVFLEAWQHRLPVICGSEGASREVVSDGLDGYVADPADVPFLADRIGSLLAEPDRAREMGEKGYLKVLAHYLDEHFRSNLARLLGSAPN